MKIEFDLDRSGTDISVQQVSSTTLVYATSECDKARALDRDICQRAYGAQ